MARTRGARLLCLFTLPKSKLLFIRESRISSLFWYSDASWASTFIGIGILFEVRLGSRASEPEVSILLTETLSLAFNINPHFLIFRTSNFILTSASFFSPDPLRHLLTDIWEERNLAEESEVRATDPQLRVFSPLLVTLWDQLRLSYYLPWPMYSSTPARLSPTRGNCSLSLDPRLLFTTFSFLIISS